MVDTVGVRTDRPFAMIDLFGTPFPEKLHVVERYRLVDYEDARDAMQRGAKENRRAGGPYDPDYKDKYLRVVFTIEDRGAFTMPWTAADIFARPRRLPRKRSAPKTRFRSQQSECRLPACGPTGFLSGRRTQASGAPASASRSAEKTRHMVRVLHAPQFGREGVPRA